MGEWNTVQVGGGGPNWNMGGRGVAHTIPATHKPTPALMTVEQRRVNAGDIGLHAPMHTYAYIRH